MEIAFTGTAQKDIDFWKKSGNAVIQQRISNLLKDIKEHPFFGIGKPEVLRYNLSGFWSRRITSEHRLVYKTEGETVVVISCRFHYH
ncbi:MAG: Txe/YoeB family addiction module toxin [Fibromonadaceae bacterium]|jgi:toxin YoeB|nr:Txe/YoeB family addiction module toxin [Fibromonadaceae bacterium]